MIPSPAAIIAKVARPAPSTWGSWAIRIRIASAFTKPVITGRGDEAHVAREAEGPEDDLDDPRHEGGREEVREPVLPDQGHDHERHGAGGGGDHRGSPPPQRR